MPLTLTIRPVEPSGPEARFGQHQFVTEHISVCDALYHTQHEADFH